MGAGNRSNLAIELTDRTARCTAFGGNRCVTASSVAIEGQDAIPKILIQHSVNRSTKLCASPPGWKYGHPMAQFGFAD